MYNNIEVLNKICKTLSYLNIKIDDIICVEKESDDRYNVTYLGEAERFDFVSYYIKDNFKLYPECILNKSKDIILRNIFNDEVLEVFYIHKYRDYEIHAAFFMNSDGYVSYRNIYIEEWEIDYTKANFNIIYEL